MYLVIVWCSHKWTGSGSGTSVMCIWLNQTESGSRYMPALDCYLLTFWPWKCRICTYRTIRWQDYLMLVVTLVRPTFFFVADVKCVSYEINKNNRATATQGLSPVQKKFHDRTEVMLDLRGPRQGSGPVLTLHVLPIQRQNVDVIFVFASGN